MNDPDIFILTGAIQSGKTTALFEWSAQRNDVSGILTPIIGARRFFYDIQSRNSFDMEAENHEKDIISVGRFHFSKDSFEKANDIIRHSINKPGWLVIDEVGPLELRENGFSITLRRAIKNHNSPLLIVVREGIVTEVTKHFDLKKFDLISKEKLAEL